jgi:hypothetical protein
VLVRVERKDLFGVVTSWPLESEVDPSQREPDAATLTTPNEGVTMAEKSPNQHNVKKVGKSLKEKRNEKHAKKESKKGFTAE